MLNSNQSYHPPFESFENDALDPEKPSIHILNHDCLDLVFSHLEVMELLKVSTVCKRWYNASLYKFSRMKQLGHRGKAHWISSNSNIHKILSRTAGNLKTLYITDSYLKLNSYFIGTKKDLIIWKSKEMQKVLKSCPNLEKLDIRFLSTKINITDLGYDKSPCIALTVPAKLSDTLAQCIPKSLKNLTIAHLYPGYLAESWTDITKGMLNLEVICVSGCNDTGEFIKENLSNNKMRRFILLNLPNMKPGSLQFILRNYCTTLECLSIDGCAKQTLEFSTTNMEPLTRMEIFTARSLFADSPCQCLPLLNLMPNLKELDLYDNDWVSGIDHFMFSLVKVCPHIEILNISESRLKHSCTTNIDLFTTNMESFSKMETFSARSADTHAVDASLCQFLPKLLHIMPNLKELDVADNYWNPAILDDHVLFSLVQLCPRIEILNLSKSHFKRTRYKRSRYEVQFSILSSLVALKDLHLGYIDDLDVDSFVDSVVGSMNSLKWLSLHQCPRLTDDHVYDIIGHTSLSRLSICNNKQLDGSFIRKCKTLDRTVRIRVNVFRCNMPLYSDDYPSFLEIIEDSKDSSLIAPKM